MRENLASILTAFEQISERLPLVVPLHPRTRKRIEEFGLEGLFRGGRVQGVEPLAYLDTLCLVDAARFVLTDSGGLQEETTALCVPCLTLRENTERPITLAQGSSRLVGSRCETIVAAAADVLTGPERVGTVPGTLGRQGGRAHRGQSLRRPRLNRGDRNRGRRSVSLRQVPSLYEETVVHMRADRRRIDRRMFLAGSVAAVMGAAASVRRAETRAPADKALIAITLDLEMSRHYPKRGMMEWDYEKGNLDSNTKNYAVEAGRIAKERGGLIHYFCVGRVLEQPDVGWLKGLVAAGHKLGNHTYDHVNVKARTTSEAQFRFARAPWLVRDKTVDRVIRENIETTTIAMKKRLGIAPDGFRTPGGFNNGLDDRPDLQKMLLDLGFSWVSSKYPAHLAARRSKGHTRRVRIDRLDTGPSAALRLPQRPDRSPHESDQRCDGFPQHVMEA